MIDASLPQDAAENVAPGEDADKERIQHLEERVAALAHALAEAEQRASGYLSAYTERVGYLEKHIAELTEAAIAREARAGADLEACRAAAAAQATQLEAHIAELTEAAIARENQAVADLEASRAASAERREQLEAQIAVLTATAIEREKQSQEREKESQDRDYQLLMIHQSLLAEFEDLEPDFISLYERCKAFTMTSVERLYSLYKCIEYISAEGIAGDAAECGVWRGGSCMLMALALAGNQDTRRRIHMFDTFEGHPQPDPEKDIDLWGNRGINEWRRHQEAGTLGEWGAASLAEVRENLISTGYPEGKLVFVPGMVETTVPANVPEALALLRLDSDWYESTRAALRYLYPKLIEGGVLIIDDYGHYRGQRQAVDEYFAEIGERPLLHRIDYSCRVMVKPHRRVTASDVGTL